MKKNDSYDQEFTARLMGITGKASTDKETALHLQRTAHQVSSNARRRIIRALELKLFELNAVISEFADKIRNRLARALGYMLGMNLVPA